MQGLFLVLGKTTPSVQIGKISSEGGGGAEATWLKLNFNSAHNSNADWLHNLNI